MPAAEIRYGGDAMRRDVGLSVRRGLLGRCPNCGAGALFRAYLKVNDKCPNCGEALHHQRADDAPPYLTMLIVGHIVVAGLLSAEDLWPNSSMAFVGAVACASALALCLLILPRVKGALIGWQWALRMHGFSGNDEAPA